jgi:hypothetical protein
LEALAPILNLIAVNCVSRIAICGLATYVLLIVLIHALVVVKVADSDDVVLKFDEAIISHEPDTRLGKLSSFTIKRIFLLTSANVPATVLN